MSSTKSDVSPDLYHIVLSTTHISKDPNNIIEKVRIPGTYTSLRAAKAAAHSCLFDAGYEREFFTQYETNKDVFEDRNLSDRQGLVVFAVASDGTTFRVRIDTTANNMRLITDYEDGRIPIPLYYIIQTTFIYNGEKEVSKVRDLNVLGAYVDYQEARKLAERILLSEEDGLSKESYEAYYEASPDDTDCGYGENVVVHAVSQYGENYSISVIQTKRLENVALAEASMRIMWNRICFILVITLKLCMSSFPHCSSLFLIFPPTFYPM
ncbi:hypothetical protein BDV27DRAFT_120219 [Aspergillus caelatus]|uniref:Uncharacterized protein n=2 Tax=Aspergillus subgen. Circumdati TaxID=2720871 RepID=A0A5N7AIU5_9EURO|nr:uncharacterized protein BDV27DRAFT_120219 [Aspergillus caelatus]KAE8369802.1 hypothetical protein BDV27DRAFT_120219 [Aspergillus caelatus]